MDFEVFTLLPEVFGPYIQSSILLRAQEHGLLGVRVHNIRDFTHDKHHTTDDVPYGGGGGMVMKPGPVFEAVETVLGFAAGQRPPCPIVLLTPQGRLFSQKVAAELANLKRVALICGRYEGVDERIRTQLATDEISVGDYVLTGGELPALVVIDAVTRLLPGALGNPDGAFTDSHSGGLLEHPHFTRPPEFRGAQVPAVLLSGDHAKIARWRRQESLRRTSERRRDLLKSVDLTDEDIRFLAAQDLYTPD
jgi:tRNA (guanine37-N1)-methyltransferase